MEAKYEIIIYWSEEDNFYVTEVPELPGCMSDGASYVEAIKNIEIVIQQWLDTVLCGTIHPCNKSQVVTTSIQKPSSNHRVMRAKAASHFKRGEARVCTGCDVWIIGMRIMTVCIAPGVSKSYEVL